MKLLVTGGAGFIGSAVIRYLLEETEVRVVNLDKLTYAASLESLDPVRANPRYSFVQMDICDGAALASLFEAEQPDAVMHLAAESHVDRSIDSAAAFIETNIIGTYRLLEVALDYWRGLPAERRASFRFHHVSTDEVFGSLGSEGLFTEDSPYQPNSPYSASKASADHLVRAWHHTHGLPVVTSNCSNNYGPYQFPEKLIPVMILNGLAWKPLPVYGRGENVRDWLFVEDHARALWAVLRRGSLGQTYNVGGLNEVKNLTVVEMVCDALDRLAPSGDGRRRRELIRFVEDRPGHDLRYAIDPAKIRRELGWTPQETFETGLQRTVAWYLDNGDWWRAIQARGHDGSRLGLRQVKTAS